MVGLNELADFTYNIVTDTQDCLNIVCHCMSKRMELQFCLVIMGGVENEHPKFLNV